MNREKPSRLGGTRQAVPFTPSASTRKAQLRAADLKRITASLQRAGRAVLEDSEDEEIGRDSNNINSNVNVNVNSNNVNSNGNSNGITGINGINKGVDGINGPVFTSNRPLDSNRPAIDSRHVSDRTKPPSVRSREEKPVPVKQPKSQQTSVQSTNVAKSSASAGRSHKPRLSAVNAGPSVLEGLGVHAQEKMIIHDLLWVLSGIDGEFITFSAEYTDREADDRLCGASYDIHPSVHESLVPLLRRILPLGSHLTALVAFLESRQDPQYGATMHALVAAVCTYVDKFAVLVADLEAEMSENLNSCTLQAVWYHVQPSFSTLSLLAGLVGDILVLDQSGQQDDENDQESDDDDDAMQAVIGTGFKDVLRSLQKSEQDKHQSGIVKGGELINAVYNKLSSLKGDPRANSLFSGILLACSQPYLKIILQWTSTGILRDPYEEVMVQETTSISKGNLDADYTDEYWEKRYTLRDGSSQSTSTLADPDPAVQDASVRKAGGSCIPPFLESWKFKILLAGKYLNVVREFGLDVPSFSIEWEQDEVIALNDPRFLRHIETAYTTANKTLLALLLTDQQLIPRLRSLKHYFFLPQADFFIHFIDLAATELRKTARSASRTKLQNLLDLSLRNPASTSAQDPYKEDVCISMASTTLYQWLETIIKIKGTSEEDIAGGIQNLEFDAASSKISSQSKPESSKGKVEKDVIAVDALQFDYSVPFPLSLVISRKTILRYQIVFRFLLHLKYTEMALCSMWQGHMYDRGKHSVWRKNNHNEQFEKWKMRVCVLRARMLVFIQQVLGFITSEVIEPNWVILERTLDDVLTVDILLREHVDFLDTCLKECMLTNATMIKVYQKIILTCYTFTSYANNFNRQATTVQTQVEGLDANDVLDMNEAWKFLLRFEENFDMHIKVHMDHITALSTQENTALLALVVRLTSLHK